MRDPQRIDYYCNELAEVWHKVPDWRLSQLMKNILNGWVNKYGTDPFYAEDAEFMSFINDYIKEITNDENW